MTTTKVLITALLVLATCLGQGITMREPASVTTVGFQLVWASGANRGQPARIPNVQVEYFMTGWQAGSGGHTHDLGPLASNRPFLYIWPLGGTNTSAISAVSTTDANGQAFFNVLAPHYAGYYQTVGWIINCNVPGLTCYQIGNELDLMVQNAPCDDTDALGDCIGAWQGITPWKGGFRIVNAEVDHHHGGNGVYLGQHGFPLKEIVTDYAALQVIAHESIPTWNIIRLSLPNGGWYEGYLVGGGDFSLAPPNRDLHQWGYSADVYSSVNSGAKASMFAALSMDCQNPLENHAAIFDFYTHRRVTSVTNSAITDNKTHIWHLYCPSPSMSHFWAAYPPSPLNN